MTKRLSLIANILEKLEEQFPEGEKDIKNFVDATFKESMREMILSEGSKKRWEKNHRHQRYFYRSFNIERECMVQPCLLEVKPKR